MNKYLIFIMMGILSINLISAVCPIEQEKLSSELLSETSFSINGSWVIESECNIESYYYSDNFMDCIPSMHNWATFTQNTNTTFEVDKIYEVTVDLYDYYYYFEGNGTLPLSIFGFNFGESSPDNFITENVSAGTGKIYTQRFNPTHPSNSIDIVVYGASNDEGDDGDIEARFKSISVKEVICKKSINETNETIVEVPVETSDTDLGSSSGSVIIKDWSAKCGYNKECLYGKDLNTTEEIIEPEPEPEKNISDEEVIVEIVEDNNNLAITFVVLMALLGIGMVIFLLKKIFKKAQDLLDYNEDEPQEMEE